MQRSQDEWRSEQASVLGRESRGGVEGGMVPGDIEKGPSGVLYRCEHSPKQQHL